MDKTNYSFLIKLIFISIIISVAGTLIFTYMPWQQPRVFYFIVLFFFIISASTHWWLTVKLKSNIRRFPAYFMGSTSIKLFSSLIFILLYAIKNPSEAKVFLITFFLIYLIFTAFETTAILSFSSKLDNKTDENEKQ
jgi:uncharacterized membrane protein HdeD (DUF308 family)